MRNAIRDSAGNDIPTDSKGEALCGERQRRCRSSCRIHPERLGVYGCLRCSGVRRRGDDEGRRGGFTVTEPALYRRPSLAWRAWRPPWCSPSRCMSPAFQSKRKWISLSLRRTRVAGFPVSALVFYTLNLAGRRVAGVRCCCCLTGHRCHRRCRCRDDG